MIMIMIARVLYTLAQIPFFVEANNVFWEDAEFPRVQSTSSCTCGVSNTTGTWKKPWLVYVHTKRVSCPGTIINSNLIVTSHKCLLLHPGRMRVMDLLKFTYGEQRIARESEITVTSSLNRSATGAIKFPIVSIWYNPVYAQSSDANSFPEQDMVLIQTNADFLSQAGYNPICVPAYEDDKKISFKSGLRGYFRNPGENRDRILGIVSRKTDCNVKPKATKGSTVCLIFIESSESAFAGVPLIVEFRKAAFLAGLAINMDHRLTVDAFSYVPYIYFSFINSLVRFIEYFSSKAESKWCQTPEFKWSEVNGTALEKESNDEDDSNVPEIEGRPWETEKPVERDESLDCLCGVRNQALGFRIVGGVQAVPREFGWMAGLKMYPNGISVDGNSCGGSIINDRMILTAAHCVVVDKWLLSGRKNVSTSPDNIYVVLNAHERNGDPKAITKHVSAVHFHPDFAAGLKEYPQYFDKDVALLVLKERLEFPAEGNGLRPVCLPKLGKYMEVVGQRAWVVGWGLTNPLKSGSHANKLQKIELPVANLSLCSDVARIRVTNNFLCVGTLDMYHDAAQGDSGGPLQIEDPQTKRWTQVGAVSYGDQVTQPDGTILTAGLYTDLQKVMNFIDYHSHRVKAKWCRSESLEVSMVAGTTNEI